MSFNFMAAVTICSDLEPPKIKPDTVSTVSPSISKDVIDFAFSPHTLEGRGTFRRLRKVHF